MKRFFCNTCKKFKRVRKLPRNVQPIMDNEGRVVKYSNGDCDRHGQAASGIYRPSTRRA